MKKINAMLICAFIFGAHNQIKSQSVTVTDAIGLEAAINCTSGCPTVINLVDNVYDLGDIPMDKFPLVVKEGVTIQGTFDIFRTTPNQGSTIVMPYQFKNGDKCVPYSYIQASVFSLKDDSQILNCKLKGPHTTIKDYAFYSYSRKAGCPGTTDISPREGLVSGIIAQGANCRIKNCEIYGFPQFGVKVHPIYSGVQCDDNADRNFYLENSYIHDNQGYGYGYGIYITGGGQSTHCTVTTPCYNGSSKFFNFDSPHVIANVTNCFFAENATDIDGSGNRCSFVISGCTFVDRGINYNIFRHDYGVYIINPENPSDTIKNEVGGNITSIQNNVFYKDGGQVVNSNYPNINDCNNSPSQEGYALINNNHFYRSSGTSTHPIVIGGLSYTAWTHPSHTHLSVTGNTNYSTLPFPFSVQTPNCVIRSKHVTQSTPVISNQEITVGESLSFDTELCYDGLGNYGNSSANNLIYFWRFHGVSDDLQDEIRTGYRTASNPLNYVFNQVGITNVTLFALDKVTGRASAIATQKITVKPANPASQTVLVLSVLDSYVGRLLKSSGTCNPYSDIRDQEDLTPTGFVKYVKINNTEIILGDIAGDNGWERHEIPIDAYLNAGNNTLEIGLKSIIPVPVELVRGVVFFVDDVYINNSSGQNILLNADFENNQASGYPDKWTLVSGFGTMQFSNSCLGNFSITNNGGAGKSFEVRSGRNSFWGYVKSFADHYYADGLTYPVGKFHGIYQTFNLNSCIKSASITTAWPQTQCSNEGVLMSANSGSGLTYQWKLNGTTIPGATSITYVAMASGSYSVDVTNSCGVTTSTPVQISILPSPSVVATASPTEICPGQSTILNATGANTYSWIDDGTLNSNIGNSVVANPSVNTTYYVVGTDANGCRDTAAVDVNIGSAVISASASNSLICNGQSTVLTATGGVSYTWSPANSLSSGTGNIVVATPTSSTTYTVTGTNAQGCSSTASVTVTVQSASVFVSASQTSICTGLSTILTATGASSYSWSPAGTLSSSTGSVVTASPVSTTTYSVIGTDVNGCTANASITISIQTPSGPAPSQPNSISGQATGLCGVTQSFNCSPSNGAAYYLWTIPTFASNLTGQGTQNISAYFGESTITNQTVCVTPISATCQTGTPRCISVYGKPGVFSSITGPNSVCQGSQNTYSIANWPFGANNNSWILSPSSAGTITGNNLSALATINANTTVCAIAANACGSRTNTKAVTVTTCAKYGNDPQSYDDELSVQPNPVMETAVLIFNSEYAGDCQFMIVNNSGKEVIRNFQKIDSGENKISVNVREFAPGIYTAVIMKSNKILKARFIVLK